MRKCDISSEGIVGLVEALHLDAYVGADRSNMIVYDGLSALIFCWDFDWWRVQHVGNRKSTLLSDMNEVRGMIKELIADYSSSEQAVARVAKDRVQSLREVTFAEALRIVSSSRYTP